MRIRTWLNYGLKLIGFTCTIAWIGFCLWIGANHLTGKAVLEGTASELTYGGHLFYAVIYFALAAPGFVALRRQFREMRTFISGPTTIPVEPESTDTEDT